MKKGLPLLFVVIFLAARSIAQSEGPSALPRPKLVVGLMVDQMRWDFLYRYYDRYGQNGFRRLLRVGFASEQTFIPDAQTVTAAGHASVYTGSVPAINGIMGNEWYERSIGRTMYCVEDPSVKTIGGSDNAPPMSPRNLWSTTISDEIRLGTNMRSKVIGIAIKDRGGILPAGHAANAAYWYDNLSGNWVTSTYYMPEVPGWVKRFNGRKVTDSLYRLGWQTLYPLSTYVQSDKDNVPYEGKFGFEQAPVFPRDFSSLVGKNYGIIAATPHGNTLTLQFARTALLEEGLGRDAFTDVLAVSLSSPDYIGHQFGPNSIEIEDTYLRLDRELGDFFDFLDRQVGKGQWTFFITADHGVANVPGFMAANKIPKRTISFPLAAMNQALQKKFGVARNLIEATGNYQVYLNHRLIDSVGLGRDNVASFLIDYLNRDSSVLVAFSNASIAAANLPTEVRERFQQGYNAKRAGDIQVILKPGIFYGGNTGTTHGSWYPYDAHIPLVFMGWGIRPGKLYRTTYMTDIAATLAAMLKVQQPDGCIGNAIGEALK